MEVELLVGLFHPPVVCVELRCHVGKGSLGDLFRSWSFMIAGNVSINCPLELCPVAVAAVASGGARAGEALAEGVDAQ